MTMAVGIDHRRRVPRQRADVWLRASGDETTLLDPSGNHLYTLNPTALALWELCDGRTSPAEMIDAICTLFTGIYDVIEEDVERTLEDFTRARLIEWDVVEDR